MRLLGCLVALCCKDVVAVFTPRQTLGGRVRPPLRALTAALISQQPPLLPTCGGGREHLHAAPGSLVGGKTPVYLHAALGYLEADVVRAGVVESKSYLNPLPYCPHSGYRPALQGPARLWIGV
ncbi:hypothetical protein SLEP1_g23298 [Rubroshorea leprosula]|uniref:Secreted protein n=1 Tax=Rubroshorea leprosula TaxID=152421 RepID=A0AAV5JI14_9ROSI|nr:hypothetical protein SLEP1_g23298 [Rubroshorea leprosula]